MPVSCFEKYDGKTITWEPLGSCSWNHLQNRVLALEREVYCTAEVSSQLLVLSGPQRGCIFWIRK